ncbi:hypothetical protein HK097_011057 [Rhizophlyctis rosea]|uniref:Uncharacterized protein n=1 Tax=Rhizophlyctis rosea TaxID=64517 RepID=A0AAD5X7A6_9FUNG|nr:hypothetical protein HK097_011057 [Rhizophlyctis rosea]
MSSEEEPQQLGPPSGPEATIPSHTSESAEEGLSSDAESLRTAEEGPSSQADDLETSSEAFPELDNPLVVPTAAEDKTDIVPPQDPDHLIQPDASEPAADTTTVMIHDNAPAIPIAEFANENEPPKPEVTKDASETFSFSLLPPPPAVTTITADDSDDFDDFDDFAAPAPAPVAAPVSEVHVPPDQDDEDDDFGDFDDFGPPPESAPPPPAPAPAPLAQPPSISLEPETPGDADEESRIEILLQSITTSHPLISELTQYLANAFPASPLPDTRLNTKPVDSILGEVESSQPSDSKQPDAKNVKLIVPNIAYSETDWYKLYQKLSADTIYAESGTTKFTWRRSLIRKAYLKSLDVAIDVDEMFKQPQTPSVLPANPLSTTSHPTADTQPSARSTQSGAGSNENEKESDLEEAKRLCDITEDEMRRKTISELQQLIQSLQTSQQRMQEQANEWLDAKERLIMDAEMHNKMIASLVQYAQQQQVGPKAGARGKSPVTKGKKVTTPGRR